MPAVVGTGRNPQFGLTMEGVARQTALLIALKSMRAEERIGAACSILLEAAYNSPDAVRAVLNESVVREGFRGEPLIAVLARAAR